MRFLFRVSSLILLVSCSSHAKNNCQAFRVGRFSQNSEIVSGTNLIIRDNGTQTEIRGFDTLKSTVKWIDDCNYELTYLPTPSVPPPLIGKTIKVKITKTTSYYYLYEAKLPGTNLVSKDTLYQISDK